MSKKNSNVILKRNFENFKNFHDIYLNFSKKLSELKYKSFVVAISGGPDSLALAALSKFYSISKKSKFSYILVNHNIRKGSSKEAIKVKKLLKKSDINLQIINNKKKIIKNIQGEARKIRYSILEKFCEKKKIKIILTAHNLEDQVETFLIRLSRGSGLTGLSSMKPLTKLNNNILLLRPFLDTKKKILIKITKKIFGRYIIDPSNKDEKFLRTKMRNLQKHLSKSGIKYDQIIKSINNLAISRNTLDEYLDKIIKDTVKKLNDKVMINIKKFNQYNLDIKIGIINNSIKKLKKNYYNLRSKKVVNLITSLKSHKFSKATLGGCLFFKEREYLCLKREKK